MTEKAARASKKQQELLQFIDGFITGHGYGPSYREVMRALGYKSVSTVAVHVNELIAKGYLEKKDNSARSLIVRTLRSPTTPPPSAADKDTVLKYLERKLETLENDKAPSEDIAALKRVRDLIVENSV
jgi:SOS-response transcriptional repressor LexA